MKEQVSDLSVKQRGRVLAAEAGGWKSDPCSTDLQGQWLGRLLKFTEVQVVSSEEG